MARSSQNLDDDGNAKRSDFRSLLRTSRQNDSLNEESTYNHFSSQQNRHVRTNDGNETYARPRNDEESPVVLRKQETNRIDNKYTSTGRIVEAKIVNIDDRKSSEVQPQVQYSTNSDHNQGYNRQSNSSERTQRSSNVYSTTRPINVKSGPLVIDINISVSVGRSNSQRTDRTHNITATLPPINSRATFDNVHYLDIDLCSPDRTAKLATDGTMRDRSLNQSTTHSHENQQ
ncbi:unnamed protein product [Rotaria sp. Silwood2]|nr:unnamed protein product [Rotaria sp. Silwood2]CAF4535222.1 unnamed protein product [Rotaria sp. Silwood2]